jgi:hypothetical protein
MILDLKNDSNINDKSQVWNVFHKRHPDIAEDIAMTQDPTNLTSLEFRTFIRVYHDPEDNTTENLTKWMETMKELFTAASEKYAKSRKSYPDTYAINGDLTGTKLEPPTHALLNKDLMYIMLNMYPDYTQEQLADSPLAEEFFGDWKDAKDYIRNFDPDGDDKNGKRSAPTAMV